jgi:hypothetical protein
MSTEKQHLEQKQHLDDSPTSRDPSNPGQVAGNDVNTRSAPE